MITIYVQKTQARAELDAPVTSGSVGREVRFQFSDDWDGLVKTAAFETNNYKETATVPESGTLAIPEDVLTYPGFQLRIGVIGKTADGATVIPTVYADCSMIKPGASTVPVGTPPTPSQAEQLQAQIDELREQGVGGGGVSIELDTTLTQSGKAADAKAVGDALKEKQEKGSYVKTVNNIKPDGNGNVSISVDSGTGDNGTDGKDGGYYIPSVEQTSQTTVEFSFTPSDPDMPTVEPETITLPVSSGGGETPGIPFFDLAAMGLPAVTWDGTEVELAADTSEIRTALAGGSVKFGFQFSYRGMTIAAEITGAPMYVAEMDMYQVSKTGIFGIDPMFISIMISGTGISAVANALQAALPNAEGASF